MDERLWQGLLCSLVEPGLRSVLLTDAAPADVLTIATMLGKVTSREGPVLVGSADSDERLWGQVTMATEPTGLQWKPGRLVSEAPILVVIPDLARVSLAATRAMVALMDAEAASVERQGKSHAWRPDCFWIAGCARDNIGEVSAHLLDRFALRLAGSIPDTGTEFPARYLNALKSAAPSATVPAPLISRILAALPAAEGFRRGLALARLTRACARLAGRTEATDVDLRQATEIIHLRAAVSTPQQVASSDAPKAPAAPKRARSSTVRKKRVESSLAGAGAPAADPSQTAPVAEPEQVNVISAEIVDIPPYPEDSASVMRPPESLRLPPRRSTASRAGEGTIVGTQPATTLNDMAWVATILRGVRFRRIREMTTGPKARLIILRSDLRSYRRAPLPQRLCVLLLDATAIASSRWDDAVLPYLRWAYVERSAVHVIQVGAADASGKTDLRARLFTGRNVLAPSVTRALEPSLGNATPLAHGLDLALRSIRNALHRGRTRVDQALFVAITDGRGNVPLETSLRGESGDPSHIGRKGIDDSLQLAREIGALQNLRSFVIQPRLTVLKELPQQLATAMNADLIEMAPREVAKA